MLTTYLQNNGGYYYLGFECFGNPERIEQESWAYYNWGLDSAKNLTWLSDNFAFIHAGRDLDHLKTVMYRREINRLSNRYPELDMPTEEIKTLAADFTEKKFNKILENKDIFIDTKINKDYIQDRLNQYSVSYINTNTNTNTNTEELSFNNSN